MQSDDSAPVVMETPHPGEVEILKMRVGHCTDCDTPVKQRGCFGDKYCPDCGKTGGELDLVGKHRVIDHNAETVGYLHIQPDTNSITEYFQKAVHEGIGYVIGRDGRETGQDVIIEGYEQNKRESDQLERLQKKTRHIPDKRLKQLNRLYQVFM